MSHCVKHTRCPECASLGKDRDGNNLAIYSDGSSYCFSCGFSESASGLQKVKKETPRDARALGLPADVHSELPPVAWDFLRQYELTENDVKVHVILWSESWSRLCFPIFDSTGLIAWQGRYLGTEKGKAKWFSQGDLKNILHVVGHKASNTCILTEDLISAIKVAKVGGFAVSPLFGSHISTLRLLRLRRYYEKILIFLDPDKRKESIIFSKNARSLGIDAHTVFADGDPKDFSVPTLTQLLTKY